MAHDSDDEVVGDESVSIISQPKSPGISPGLSQKSRGSPRLFYGERSRESFSNKGFAPGSKLRQSKQHQHNHSNTFLSESTITEDPERISVPNRSGQYNHQNRAAAGYSSNPAGAHGS